MKRFLSILVCVLLAAGVFAGCGDGGAPTPASDAPAQSEVTDEQAPDEGGDETAAPSDVSLVYAQQHVTDEAAMDAIQKALDDYSAETGVAVRMEAVPEADYRTWLTTQFTAGTGPDVYNAIIYDATTDYHKGWLYNFADLYEAESKYDTGKPWKDTLPESILERMYITPEGEIPGYPTYTSVVRIFCNMDLFAAAGVEQPGNWAEFMEVCAKLQDAETIPFAFPNATIADLSWLWFNNSVSSQLNNQIIATADVSGNGFIELNEICKAVDDGQLDFTAPELKAGFELMKDFSQYWTSDYNSLDRTTAIEMFLRGETAMIQALSGDLRMIDELAEFNYAVMPVPVVTKETSEYAMEKSVVLGGQPDGILCINGANDGAQLDASIDFVQYIASPVQQALFAQEIFRIPLATSVELPSNLEGFVITEEPLRLGYYTGVNEQIRNYFHRAGQQYLEGSIELDAMCDILNESYREVLSGIMTENDWSAENNYKIGEAE